MLKINERFRVNVSDDYNVELLELCDVTDKKTKTTKKVWKHVGWFGKVSQALSCARDKHLRAEIEGDDIKSINELLSILGKEENDLKSIDIVVKRIKVAK